MKIFILIVSIAFPIAMAFLQHHRETFRTIFNILAIVASLVFGNIAAASIYQILVDNTVFMTAIHGIFLNPYFLASGAYFGVFIVYRLILLAADEKA
ncbi:transposase [Bacillus badius]|uniref:transposase n=1 Tax=Bacillus badius TaxID=1455 RepID=UPI001CBE9234|nr:transposase [Bacillus badius]MED0665036.1 transposase [Bacillus badius]UAT29132.1 transposase [Bacillus badius]